MRQLAHALGDAPTDTIPHAGEADRLLLSADRTPNARGAALTGVAAAPMGARLAGFAERIGRGELRALVVVGEDVTAHGLPAGLLAKLDLLVAVDILPHATTGAAHFVLPGAAYAEKAGTFVNAKGILQRFTASVPPPGEARPEGRILGELLCALTGRRADDVEEIFAAMARSLPALSGLTWKKIGPQGVKLELG